jgi:hypothetical protein
MAGSTIILFIEFYLNIAGIATGLLAAIPGIIDYHYTVSPKSSPKKRAVKHGLINTSVIILRRIPLGTKWLLFELKQLE